MKFMSEKSTSPIVYLAAGLVIGLFVAFLLFLSQQQSEPVSLKDSIAKAAKDAREVREQEESDPTDSSFDFYEMLPELEVSVGEEGTVTAKPKRPAPPAQDTASEPSESVRTQSAPAPVSSGTIYLQVGAYSKFESADQQKAGLLLQNWPTKVQSATKDDGRKIYRVFVGPYSEGASLDSAERQLKSMGLKPYRHQVSG